MKKLVMLSAMTMLSLAGVAVSQAETTASATASSVAPATASASASTTASTASVTADTAKQEKVATKKDEIPQDPPQVQKLIALYPKLIARIAPQGKVCFEGKECDITIAAQLGAADPNNPREGKTIYEGVCHTCHATGLLGSPKFGDKAGWSARVGKGNATLYDHAINGFNAMPAKGGKSDLLDEEVKNAVDYMLASVK